MQMCKLQEKSQHTTKLHTQTTEGFKLLRLQRKEIPLSGEVKYLEVILDSKLTCNQQNN